MYAHVLKRFEQHLNRDLQARTVGSLFLTSLGCVFENWIHQDPFHTPQKVAKLLVHHQVLRFPRVFIILHPQVAMQRIWFAPTKGGTGHLAIKCYTKVYQLFLLSYPITPCAGQVCPPSSLTSLRARRASKTRRVRTLRRRRLRLRVPNPSGSA